MYVHIHLYIIYLYRYRSIYILFIPFIYIYIYIFIYTRCPWVWCLRMALSVRADSVCSLARCGRTRRGWSLRRPCSSKVSSTATLIGGTFMTPSPVSCACALSPGSVGVAAVNQARLCGPARIWHLLQHAHKPCSGRVWSFDCAWLFMAGKPRQ